VRGLVVVAVVVALAAACSDGSKPAAKPKAAIENKADGPSDQWQCFVVDPGTPKIDAGNVTHSKHRYLPDRYETTNVNVRNGVHRTSWFTLKRTGDHYELADDDGTYTMVLDEPDGSRSTLQFRGRSEWKYSDVTVIDDDGMTITSTDYDADGTPVKTTVKFRRAPCYVVDAALRRYGDDK
jgi:hypothetical protein